MEAAQPAVRGRNCLPRRGALNAARQGLRIGRAAAGGRRADVPPARRCPVTSFWSGPTCCSPRTPPKSRTSTTCSGCAGRTTWTVTVDSAALDAVQARPGCWTAPGLSATSVEGCTATTGRPGWCGCGPGEARCSRSSAPARRRRRREGAGLADRRGTGRCAYEGAAREEPAEAAGDRAVERESAARRLRPRPPPHIALARLRAAAALASTPPAAVLTLRTGGAPATRSTWRRPPSPGRRREVALRGRRAAGQVPVRHTPTGGRRAGTPRSTPAPSRSSMIDALGQVWPSAARTTRAWSSPAATFLATAPAPSTWPDCQELTGPAGAARCRTGR